MPNANVAAVILAAGSSSRFGTPKQLVEWENRPLVLHAADVAWMAGLDPIVVVTGEQADRVAELFAARSAAGGQTVHLVRNYRHAEGMSSSIFLGVSSLPATTQAAIFMPIDQPLITASLLRALVRRWEERKSEIVVPVAGGTRRGTPALFTRALFPELARLSGDTGGRALFDAHAGQLEQVSVEDPAQLEDADTPEALARLEAHRGRAFDWSDVRAVIADMDGVLWRHRTPLPGVQDFFHLIRSAGIAYQLVTNNSSRSPEQYAEKLAEMGVPVSTEHILTSAQATAGYLAERADPGTRVYVIGSDGILNALRERGFEISAGDEAAYVVVGWDRDLTWEKLATATRLIRGGAGFVSTNPDRTFPMEGYQAPGNGAQSAALQAATGVEPIFIGKPSPILYKQALERTGTTPEESLMIGDRLDTDILGGLRLGMPTALLLSGVSQREELISSPIRPQRVFQDLADLVATWRKEV